EAGSQCQAAILIQQQSQPVGLGRVQAIYVLAQPDIQGGRRRIAQCAAGRVQPLHMTGQQGDVSAGLDTHGFYQLYVLVLSHDQLARPPRFSALSIRAFHMHSCHSSSGSESYTIPPPTPKMPCCASCISMVRMATFSEQSPFGASQPTLPQ